MVNNISICVPYLVPCFITRVSADFPGKSISGYSSRGQRTSNSTSGSSSHGRRTSNSVSGSSSHGKRTSNSVTGSSLNGRGISNSGGSGDSGNNHIAAQTFRFRDMATATRNFRADCLLGEGGFGRVYKGRLNNNQVRRVEFAFQLNYLLCLPSWKCLENECLFMLSS